MKLLSRVRIMGIINCTPDSFYPGSRRRRREEAVAAAQEMIRAELDIIDLGGESTRPGSTPVSTDEELERVIPVVEAIRGFSAISLSVDTTKSQVAEQALAAGADMINDISGLRRDPSMAAVIARHNAEVVLMHSRGVPQTMQQNVHYADTLAEIKAELKVCIDTARQAGISRIIIDPGIGFAKRLADNLLILKYLNEFKKMGYPVLVGLSRKSFLGEILQHEVEQRLIGSLSAAAVAVFNGADILRVHDFKETKEMLKVVEAIDHA